MQMDLDEAIQAWEQGLLTDRGLYEICETDLEFYNILNNALCSEDRVKEIMREVSGADDAYYNALAQAEEED